MMRAIFLILSAALSFCFCVNTVKAEKRVALVIGNSAYQNVPRLANPANDAAAIGAMFRKVGFHVVETRPDVGIVEMRRIMRDFSDKSSGADISVVYFAGHGMEVEGINYLIPIDAVLERDRDAFDEAMQLDRVLQAVEPAKKLRLVILDACRDNPFQRTMKRALASRALGRGLATVEPTKPNTLIAFAAKGGSTADDGSGTNSPFAAALLKHLATPGLDLRKAFGFVRDDVMNATGNRQEPFVYGSLGGDDVSLVPAAVVPNPVASPNGSGPNDPDLAIRRNYELAERIGTREAWNYFLVSYPTGFYADLARAQRNKLVAGESRQVATSDSLPTKETAKASRPSAQGERPIGQVAALPPQEPRQIPGADRLGTTTDMTRLLQTELKRVGCNAGAVDGKWNTASQRSLQLFNRYAGTKLDVKLASLDGLEAVKSKTSRVCPLICNNGYKADGDRCIRIECKAGFEIGDNNKCQRIAIKSKQAPSAALKKREQSGGRCTSIQARCAVAIGGRCEPDTGKWYYGRSGAGGSVMAHNECLSRELRAGRH